MKVLFIGGTGQIYNTRRMIAVFLIMMMAFLTPAVQIQGASKPDLIYIKDVRLYICNEKIVDKRDDKSETTTRVDYGLNDAKSWCEKQGSDWHVGSGNLNAGAAGAFTTDKSVFLCYQTTTDPKEAVTDIAVMNEKGNYDFEAYEVILKEQKEKFVELVDSLKSMLSEYRKNYENKVETAVKAHDIMNLYIEDESKRLLGDLLLDINDEDLTDVLLQANGQVVIFIERELAAACDTGNNTWFDRMSKLGSFKGLRKKYITACKGNAAAADKALDIQYKEKAVELSESWNDLKDHLDHGKDFLKKYDIEGKTAEEIDEWRSEHTSDPEVYTYDQEYAVITALMAFKYDGKSLFDYFSQDVSAVTGKNLKELYPLVECLSEGQQAGVNGSVSMFTLAQDTLAAIGLNDYKKGIGAEIEESLTDEEKETAKEAKEYIDNEIDAIKEVEAISIYEGVDRELFKSGVAVTSTARDYSKSSENRWYDAFIESGLFKKVEIGLVGGTLLTGALALYGKMMSSTLLYRYTREIIGSVSMRQPIPIQLSDRSTEAIQRVVWDFSKGAADDVTERGEALIRKMYRMVEFHRDESGDMAHALTEVADKSMAKSWGYKIHMGLKTGATVFCVILSVASIVVTVVTLYQYYNRDHLPIPKRLVDLSHNENNETVYTAYKSILDQNEKAGDLNAGSSKQWLAIYMTKDEWAGNPILAPENGEGFDFITQTGKKDTPENYAPLHLFGTPSTPQNLTFADGENGWSYNDKKNGTYFFFRRADSPVDKSEEADPAGTDETGDAASGSAVDTSNTGTVSHVGINVLFGSGVLVVGIILGFVISEIRRKKSEGGQKNK